MINYSILRKNGIARVKKFHYVTTKGALFTIYRPALQAGEFTQQPRFMFCCFAAYKKKP